MTAPTLVSTTNTAFTKSASSSATTASISVQTGDILVARGATEDSGFTLTISGGGLTWTLQQSNVIASHANTYIWTATAASTTTLTVTVTCGGFSGNVSYGVSVEVWRNSNGVGNSAKNNATSGSANVSLTTASANSGVSVIAADWNAVNGSSRTWRTINGSAMTENLYVFVSGVATYYGADTLDAGSVGANTYGTSAPTGEQFTIIAVEIKGTASSGAISGTTTLTFNETGALTGSGALSASSGMVIGQTGALTGSGALTATSALVIGETGALTGSGALAGSIPVVIGETGSLTGAGALSGTTALVIDASGTLTPPSGALTGTTALVIGIAGTVSGSGILSGTSSLTVGESGVIAGGGSLVGESDLVFSAVATPTLPGALQGATSMNFGGSGDVAGIGALIGASQIVISAQATPAGGQPAGKHRRRYGVRDGNYLLVFDSRAEAEEAKRAIASRDLPKPKNARRIKVKPIPTPDEKISLPELANLASAQQRLPAYESHLQAHDFSYLADLYHELHRRQEEEDIALTLLHQDAEERQQHIAHVSHVLDVVNYIIRRPR